MFIFLTPLLLFLYISILVLTLTLRVQDSFHLFLHIIIWLVLRLLISQSRRIGEPTIQIQELLRKLAHRTRPSNFLNKFFSLSLWSPLSRQICASFSIELFNIQYIFNDELQRYLFLLLILLLSPSPWLNGSSLGWNLFAEPNRVNKGIVIIVIFKDIVSLHLPFH